MKITIAPTNDKVEFQHNTVTIETPYDELTLDEIIDVISKALYAFGFDNEGVVKYLLELKSEI